MGTFPKDDIVIETFEILGGKRRELPFPGCTVGKGSDGGLSVRYEYPPPIASIVRAVNVASLFMICPPLSRR